MTKPVKPNPERATPSLSRRTALAGASGLAALATFGPARQAAAQAASPTATDDLEANKALVVAFYDAFYGPGAGGDPDAIDPFVAEDYIQHEEGVDQGRDGLKALLRQMATHPPSGAPELRHLIAEGDIVVAHQIRPGAGPDDPPLAEGVDIFRIENGLLAEHWGVGVAYAQPTATPAAG